jgi:hypothetical protein
MSLGDDDMNQKDSSHRGADLPKEHLVVTTDKVKWGPTPPGQLDEKLPGGALVKMLKANDNQFPPVWRPAKKII